MSRRNSTILGSATKFDATTAARRTLSGSG